MNYEVKADPLAAAFETAAPLPPVVTRTPLASGKTTTSAFVDGYIRRGETMELKSFSGVTPADGGYAVPRELDAEIQSTLKNISPLRAVANVVQVGTSGYRKLVTRNGVASGWAADNAARPETGTPVFEEIVPSFGDLYANPAATQAMLDDAAFDVEGWLANEIAMEFAKAEGTAFIKGDGTNKPKGFLSYTTSVAEDGTRAFGQIQHIATGNANGLPTTAPQDKLVELLHALRAPYRNGAVWVMNSKTLSSLRRFKTTDGAMMWQQSLSAAQPDTLLGYPVIEAEDMPDIAANSTPIAFGNFKAGYVIAERGETAILRDPFTNKPFVHFYATKRLGGAVSNSEAIKLLKVAG
jgi:HK97 family phage major capsid protein